MPAAAEPLTPRNGAELRMPARQHALSDTKHRWRTTCRKERASKHACRTRPPSAAAPVPARTKQTRLPLNHWFHSHRHPRRGLPRAPEPPQMHSGCGAPFRVAVAAAPLAAPHQTVPVPTRMNIPDVMGRGELGARGCCWLTSTGAYTGDYSAQPTSLASFMAAAWQRCCQCSADRTAEPSSGIDVITTSSKNIHSL
jgi:hypothetical protein